MRKNGILCLIIMMIAFMLSGCVWRNQVEDKLDSLKIETEKMPAYVCYDALYIDDKKIIIDELLEDNSIKGDFCEVFIVKDERIWFSYSQDTPENTEVWNIASMDIEGKEIKVHYSNEFCLNDESDKSYFNNDNRYRKERYTEANGYYYDEKIVMTDHVKLIEYDISNGRVKEFLIDEYEYPEMTFSVEIVDYQKVYFTTDSETKELDVTKASEKSEAFMKIKEFENEKNWSKESYLKYLFDNVQVVGDNIYITCCVMNYMGEMHAVVFQYDFEQNECKYVFNHFMNGLVNNSLYVVSC